MRTYRQVTTEERYIISHLRSQGKGQAEIAREVGRDRSTIWREFRRNSSDEGVYRPSKAVEKTHGRRVRSRKKPQFTEEQFALVERLLLKKWSPDQISKELRINGQLSISYETIYRYIWKDKILGGELHKSLRQSTKKRRKRYGAYDSRGIMAGKRSIDERPRSAENRSRKGHYEIDTMMGRGSKHCVLTMVDRKTGYVIIRKLGSRTTEEVNAQLLKTIECEKIKVRTITADNGTEFHQFRQVEQQTPVRFYFARPYHSWERGTNENTNGLIRQYLPKTMPMTGLTQSACDEIANELNERPRKRYGYKTPNELHFR
jgi:transposase, IS30 family